MTPRRDLQLRAIVAGLLGACSTSNTVTGARDTDASMDARGDGSGGVAGAGGTGGTGASAGTGTAGTGAAGVGAAGSGGTSAGASGSGGTGAADASGGTGGVATDGAPPTPACKTGAFANVLFCDDFESGLASWRRLPGAGTEGETILSANPVHGGSRALRSTKSAPGPLDPLFANVLGGRRTGKLFARLWLFIPNSVVISPGGNASLLVLGEGAPGDGGVSLALWETATTIQVYDPSGNPQLTQTAAFQTPLPRQRWFCAQLDFPIGAAVSNGEFRLRIDGTQLVNSEPPKTVDSVLASPYERLWVGVNYINNVQSSPVIVHYDDVFVDTTDVACQ